MSTEIEVLKELLAGANSNLESPEKKTTLTETSTPIDVPPEIDNLSEIIKTRDNIAKVKESFMVIVDTIADNPSMLNRLSEHWGKMPTWLKVSTGLAITCPPLLAGAAAGLVSLLVLGGATGVVYTATGIVLEDHHVCNEHIKQRLREGISSITDILEITIVALDNIRLTLAQQVGKFKEENLKLAHLVTLLQDRFSTLSIEIAALENTEIQLQKSKADLQKKVIELNKLNTEQAGLLKRNQDELLDVTKSYTSNQKKLDAKIEELATVREQMSIEITRTQKISHGLKDAVSTLSGQVLEERAMKQRFQAKLDQLIAEKEERANIVLDRMTETHKELERAKDDLNKHNEWNGRLLDTQEELIKKMEKIHLMSLRRKLDLSEDKTSLKSSVAASSIFKPSTQSGSSTGILNGMLRNL